MSALLAPTADALKAQGNALFGEGAYGEAIARYGAALAQLAEEKEKKKKKEKKEEKKEEEERERETETERATERATETETETET